MSQWAPQSQDPRRQQQYGRQQQRGDIQQQQPQYAQPSPPPAYYQPPAPQFPRESVTTSGMGGGEIALHWLMIICTCGFWWPVYAGRKHAANRKSVTRYR